MEAPPACSAIPDVVEDSHSPLEQLVEPEPDFADPSGEEPEDPEFPGLQSSPVQTDPLDPPEPLEGSQSPLVQPRAPEPAGAPGEAALPVAAVGQPLVQEAIYGAGPQVPATHEVGTLASWVTGVHVPTAQEVTTT